MNRLDSAKALYPNLDWNVLKTFDPSKSQKYLQWLGANFSYGSPESLRNLILNFEKKKDKLSQKDINKYSAEQLANELAQAAPSRREEKRVGATEVTDDSLQGAKIYLIEGEKAAKQYFANTKWCISNFSTFIHYAKTHNIFVVCKNDTKFCVLVNVRNTKCDAIYDVQDTPVNRKMLETVSRLEGTNSSILPLIETCEKFSSKVKNFWSSNKRDFSKALSLASVYTVWYTSAYDRQNSFFCTEDNLDTLLKLKSVNEVFDAMIKCMKSATELSLIDFVFKHRVKYANLAKKFSSSKKKVCAHSARKTLSVIWKELLSRLKKEKNNSELLNQVKKFGGLAKLLKDKDVALLISKKMKGKTSQNE